MANYFYTWTAQKNAQNFDIHSSKGHKMITQEGREFFDLSSTSFQVSFGHSCQEIIKEIEKQLKILPISSPKADFRLKEEVTEDLLDLLQLKGKIFYTVSGAESIENALKMARQIKNKKTIVAQGESYHGATLGALSITGDWRNQDHFTIDDWTLRIPPPREDQDAVQAIKIMKAYGTQKIAAICLETITGGNGVFEASQHWWNQISIFCKKENIFLILDEVICGFYRTEKAFAFHHYQLSPDMIALSKSISGGYIPLGAIWTSPEIATYYEDKVLSCGLTLYAHPLGLAALKGVMKIIKSSSFLPHLNDLTSQFKNKLEKINQLQFVREIRQKGLLAAIDMKKEGPSPSFKHFLNHDLYLSIINNRILLAPALNYSLQDLEEAMEKFYLALKDAYE